MFQDSLRDSLSIETVEDCFNLLDTCPSKLTILLSEDLLSSGYRPDELWKYSEVIVRNVRKILQPETPRQIKGI